MTHSYLRDRFVATTSISIAMLVVIMIASTTATAQDNLPDEPASEVTWSVTFSQHFSEAGNAEFVLGPGSDESQRFQSGSLDVNFESDAEQVAGNLSGKWYELKIWWFSIWIGVAENEDSQIFTMGGQWDDGLYGKAYVRGQLPLTGGGYRIVGKAPATPAATERPAQAIDSPIERDQ